MTDSYKSILLNYVTGNIEPGIATFDEIIKEQIEQNRTAWGPFLPNSWDDFHFEGLIKANENTSNLTIIYGGYQPGNTPLGENAKGIIMLLDFNMTPIKVFTKYDSGTDLRYIQSMIQVEDNTFCFIDDTYFAYDSNAIEATSEKRFVMINNITAVNIDTNDYNLILRKSYIFDASFENFYAKQIFKNSSSAHYIFAGSKLDSNNEYRYVKIVDFKINVGSSNEWYQYTTENITTSDLNTPFFLYGNATVEFDGDDNAIAKVICTSTVSSNRSVQLYSLLDDQTTTMKNIAAFNFHPYIDTNFFINQCCYTSSNEVYFVLNNQHWGITGVLDSKYIGLYKYNFATQQTTTIFEKYLGEYDFCNLEAMYISSNLGDLYIEYNTNYDAINYTSDYYYQRYQGVWNPIYLGNYKFLSSQRGIYVQNNYNLTSIFIYPTNPRLQTWTLINLKEDYYPLNYNGLPYEDYNALIPDKCELFSNNSLVYARDYTNVSINDNQTIATLLIPNTYLNNTTIDSQNMYSKTNIILVDNEEEISKNIFESIYLNHINTLNVYDTNETTILLPNSSNYINSNINVGTAANNNNSFIGKAKVIYEDSSDDIINIKWYNVYKYNAITSFKVTPTKTVEQIQLLSNDETTIYLTMNYENITTMEIGETYTLNQLMSTKNKITFENLFYNDVQVVYNSVDVKAGKEVEYEFSR